MPAPRLVVRTADDDSAAPEESELHEALIRIVRMRADREKGAIRVLDQPGVRAIRVPSDIDVKGNDVFSIRFHNTSMAEDSNGR
jgi:hypothetical protein